MEESILIYTKRNIPLTKSLYYNILEKELSGETIYYISEHRNADFFIDIQTPKLRDITKSQWEIYHSIDLSQVILPCRLLRTLSWERSTYLILKAICFFDNFFTTNKFKKLYTLPVDSYILDIMVRLARHHNIEIVGFTRFFKKDYFFSTIYGEANKLRLTTDREVEEFISDITDRSQVNGLAKRHVAIFNWIKYYIQLNGKYIIHYLFFHKILGLINYDYMVSKFRFRFRDAVATLFHLTNFSNVKLDEVKKKVYIPLHFYPECSYDYWIDNYKDSLYINAIVEVANHYSLRQFQIFIKEHPNFYLLRNSSFYRELKGIPGVVLLDPYIDSFEMFKKVDLVHVWTGTTGIEACFAKVPVAVKSANFWSSGIFKKWDEENLDPLNEKQLRELASHLLEISYNPNKHKINI